MEKGLVLFETEDSRMNQLNEVIRVMKREENKYAAEYFCVFNRGIDWNGSLRLLGGHGGH